MLEQLKRFDTDLLLLLNGAHSPFWDDVMWFFSEKLVWIPLYLLIFYFFFRTQGKQAFWTLGFTVLLVLLADQGSVQLFKNVFERPRPCHEPDLQPVLHMIGGCGGAFGFVSSHAANTFALAMFSASHFGRSGYAWAIFLWAAVVSYSRVYLGVHYPGDILGGALWGVLVGLLVYRAQLWAQARWGSAPK